MLNDPPVAASQSDSISRTISPAAVVIDRAVLVPSTVVHVWLVFPTAPGLPVTTHTPKHHGSVVPLAVTEIWTLVPLAAASAVKNSTSAVEDDPSDSIVLVNVSPVAVGTPMARAPVAPMPPTTILSPADHETVAVCVAV